MKTPRGLAVVVLAGAVSAGVSAQSSEPRDVSPRTTRLEAWMSAVARHRPVRGRALRSRAGVVSFSPAGVAKDGWHRLDVRVKNRRATIKARAGYQAGA